MKSIIRKVPTLFFFLALILGPGISIILTRYFPEQVTFERLLLLDIFQWLVIFIWTASMVAFFNHESNSTKNTKFIYSLIVLTALASILYDYVWSSGFLLIAMAIFHIASVILIISKIKKVFYARSTWFIVIELLFILIGFLTLTPEIKRWNKAIKSQ